MAKRDSRPAFLDYDVTEQTLRKWKMIQIASILPLLLSVFFLFHFHGSMLGTIVFFLILIVGVIMPQVYRDLVLSHLRLKDELRQLRDEVRTPSQES